MFKIKQLNRQAMKNKDPIIFIESTNYTAKKYSKTGAIQSAYK